MAGLSKVTDIKGRLMHAYNPIKATKNDWSALTSAPKNTTPLPTAMPTVDQALIDQQLGDIVRRRKGRAATVMAGDSQVPAGSLAAQTLLGS